MATSELLITNTETRNPYTSLKLEEATIQREMVQNEYWDIMDLLQANRAKYEHISKYITSLMVQS